MEHYLFKVGKKEERWEGRTFLSIAINSKYMVLEIISVFLEKVCDALGEQLQFLSTLFMLVDLYK